MRRGRGRPGMRTPTGARQGRGQKVLFSLLSLITHHEDRIASAAPQVVQEQHATPRTSHVAFAPNLCNRECCPTARRLESQAAARALGPRAAQHSTAQHSIAQRSAAYRGGGGGGGGGGGSLARLRMRALHQANGTPSSDD